MVSGRLIALRDDLRWACDSIGARALDLTAWEAVMNRHMQEFGAARSVIPKLFGKEASEACFSFRYALQCGECQTFVRGDVVTLNVCIDLPEDQLRQAGCSPLRALATALSVRGREPAPRTCAACSMSSCFWRTAQSSVHKACRAVARSSSCWSFPTTRLRLCSQATI